MRPSRTVKDPCLALRPRITTSIVAVIAKPRLWLLLWLDNIFGCQGTKMIFTEGIKSGLAWRGCRVNWCVGNFHHLVPDYSYSSLNYRNSTLRCRPTYRCYVFAAGSSQRRSNTAFNFYRHTFDTSTNGRESLRPGSPSHRALQGYSSPERH